MIFIILCAVYVAGSIGCWASLRHHRVLSSVPALVLFIPFGTDVVLESVGPPSACLFDSISYWSWAVSFSGGLGFIIHCALFVRAYRTDPLPGPLFALSLCILLSFYLIGVVIDHASFFSQSRNASLVDLSSIRLTEPITDVRCDSQLLLVSNSPQGHLLYRCPLSILFGSATGQPFLPWPDYVEARSLELESALRTSEVGRR